MAGCGCIDCTDITIPSGSTGATGPAGPAGSNGTNGTDGVSVLVNDISNNATIGTNLEILKTYTIPAATLTTDESFLYVKGRFSTSTATTYSSTKKAFLYFNGALMVSYTFNADNIGVVEFELYLNRFSNTVLKSKVGLITYYNIIPFASGALSSGYTANGGLNLTTTAYDITARANSDVIGDITCESLTVLKYKK